MINEFRQRLDEAAKEGLNKRQRANELIQGKIDYSSHIARVDADLELLGIPAASLKNGYRILAEEQEQSFVSASVWAQSAEISQVIDLYAKNGKITDAMVNMLASIMNDQSKRGIHGLAAFAAVAACERRLTSGGELAGYKDYMKLLEEAFNVLVKEEDNDVCYAQWGHILYENVFKKLLLAGQTSQAMEICREAYEKFARVKNKKLKSVRKYLDCANTQEELEYEVKLAALKEKGLNAKLNEVFGSVLDEGVETKRELLRQYRYEILRNGIKLLAGTDKPLEPYKEKIINHKESFLGNMDVVFNEYEQMHSARNRKKLVSDFKRQIEESIANIHKIPDYAIGYMPSVEWYRSRLKELSCSQKNIERIKKMSSDIDDEGCVPKDIVARYLAQADSVIEKEIRAKINKDREKRGREAFVADYRSKAIEKINEILSVPEFATGYATLYEYRKELIDAATADSVCSDVGKIYHMDESSDDENVVVSDEVVEMYVSRVIAETNKKIRVETDKLKAEAAKREAKKREKANKEACVDDYKKKIDNKLREINKLSILNDNEKLFNDLDDYRSLMKNEAMGAAYISKIEERVAAEKWNGSVPDTYVDLYFEQAQNKVMQYARQRKGDEERKIREACEKDYEGKITRLLNGISVVPSYARGKCKDVHAYTTLVKGYCKTAAISRDIGDAAIKNNWRTVVPDREVRKRFDEAVANVKKDVKVPFGNKIKTVTSNVAGGIKSGITGVGKVVIWPFKMVATGVVKVGKPVMKVGGVVLVIGCAIYFVGRPIYNYFDNYRKEWEAQKLEEAKSDEGLEEAGVKEIIKNIAKLSSTATAASEFTYEMKYDDYIIIKKYNGTAESVEIPAVIEGKNVCEISNDAFKDNIYLKKVIMPDTILYVQAGAFMNCKLLQEVGFSDNIVYIGRDAFNGCEVLKSVELKGSKLSLRTIDSGAFANCSALESATITADTFNSVYLNEGAFSTCPVLKSVAISGKNMDNISLGKNAFINCSVLSTIDVKGEDNLNVVLGEGTFRSCTSLVSVPFSGKITQMEAGAFADCSKLATFDFEKLTYVPYQSFMNCTSLTEVKFSKLLGDVQKEAFLGCTALANVSFTSVSLGADNEGYVINDAAFKQTAISEIDIPGQYRMINAHSFADCPNLTKFVWHNSGKNTLNQEFVFNAFYESYALKEVYLPKTIGVMENFWHKWTPDMMGDFTVYATEGSTVHTYATEKGIKWSAWTE